MQTCSAILAGSMFSCALLHMVFIWPMDRALQLWPHIRLKKFVDDVSVQVIGSCEEVSETMPAAVHFIVQSLEGDGMPVSRGHGGQPGGKSGLLVSSEVVRRRLQGRMLQMGIGIVPMAKYLGVQAYGIGKRKGRSVQVQRADDVKRKWYKLRTLKKAGGSVHKVAKHGLKPAMMYGAKCLGLADVRVNELRRITSASLPGNHRARSTTVRLAMYKCDPALDADVAPLLAWARAIWDQAAPKEDMMAAWRRQMIDMGPKPRWAQVRGPASACRSTLCRMGWPWPRYDTFVTDDGFQLHLDTVCPRDVQHIINHATQRRIWRGWATRHPELGLEGAPFIAPITRFMAARALPERVRKAGAGAVQTGQWTQARQQEAGLVQEDFCRACGPGCKGTEQHRLYCCPAFAEQRAAAPHAWQQAGRQAQECEVVFTRGLLADPAEEWTFEEVADVELQEHPLEDPFTGHVCTDGSLKGIAGICCSTGWAAVQLQSGEPMAPHCYGPMPAIAPCQQRILRAELWAVLQTLRRARAPICIHTDNAEVVRGFRRGRRWCSSSDRPHADVWRTLWFANGDIQALDGDVNIVKCKAHVPRTVKEELAGLEREIVEGNELADAYAKKAADDTGALSAVRADKWKADCRKVQGVLQFIGSFVAKVDEWVDAQPLPKARAGLWAGPAAGVRGQRREARRPHKLVLGWGRLSCARCGRWAEALQARRAFRRSECPGPPHGLKGLCFRGEDTFVNGHRLACTGRWIWCRSCGANAATTGGELGFTVPTQAEEPIRSQGQGQAGGRSAPGDWRGGRAGEAAGARRGRGEGSGGPALRWGGLRG